MKSYMSALKKIILIITLLFSLVLLIGCNSNTGYEDAWEFNEGLAAVKLRGLYGFIDVDGNLTIEPSYDEGSYFHSGMALVKKDGLYGVIDKNNNVIIPFEYSEAAQASEDLISVKKDDKYGCINLSGEVIIDFISSEPILIHSTLYRIDATPIVKNKIAIITENNLQGFIDLDTGFMIEPTYTQINPWVGNIDKNTISIELNGKYGLINLDTKKIIEPKYSQYISFQEGLASVYIDNKYGYIDSSGEIVISPIYDQAGYFSKGMASVITDGKAGCINKKGEVVIPLIYDYITDFFAGYITTVVKDNKTGIINTKGELLCEPKFQWINLSPDTDMFPAYYENEQGEFKYVYINVYGEILFSTNYTEINPFYSEVSQVAKDGKYGFLAKNGMEIIPPIYEEMVQYGDTFQVKLDGKYGIIDKNQRTLLKFEYTNIQSGFNATTEIYFINKESKWGTFNASNNKLTDPIYDEIKIGWEAPYAARIEDKWFYIDVDGNKL